MALDHVNLTSSDPTIFDKYWKWSSKWKKGRQALPVSKCTIYSSYILRNCWKWQLLKKLKKAFLCIRTKDVRMSYGCEERRSQSLVDRDELIKVARSCLYARWLCCLIPFFGRNDSTDFYEVFKKVWWNLRQCDLFSCRYKNVCDIRYPRVSKLLIFFVKLLFETYADISNVLIPTWK